MNEITSVFGEKDAVHHIAHNGIDFAMPTGTWVRSFASGIVQKVEDEGTRSFGKSVWIKLSDGYTAVYGHLSSVWVKVGDHVAARTILAKSGDTGFSTGPHLHVGILDPRGHWIDPSRYVDIDQITHPALLYGAQSWADHSVSSLFTQFGDSIGSGLHHIAVEGLLSLNDHMPEIAVTILVVGGFLKMLGAHTWSSRAFVIGGIGCAWVIIL